MLTLVAVLKLVQFACTNFKYLIFAMDKMVAREGIEPPIRPSASLLEITLEKYRTVGLMRQQRASPQTRVR